MIYLLWFLLRILCASTNVEYNGILFGEFRTGIRLAETVRELMVLLRTHLSRESVKGQNNSCNDRQCPFFIQKSEFSLLLA